MSYQKKFNSHYLYSYNAIQAQEENRVVAMLDQIPELSEKIKSNLERFSISMMNSISIVDLETMLLVPLFKDFRNRILLDTLTYYKFIVPATQDLLEKSSNLFERFAKDYKDLDTFMKKLDVLLEDINIIKTGFEMCRKMHYKVAEQAQVRNLQAKTMNRELGFVNQQYEQDIDELKEQANQKLQQANKLRGEKVNSAWMYVPIANIVHTVNYNGKIEEELNAYQSKVIDYNNKISKVNKLASLCITLDGQIIPALRAYTQTIKQLAAIFVEFARNVQSIKELRDKYGDDELTQKRAKLFHSGVKKRANQLSGNLVGVIHLYNGVKTEFEEMEKSQAIKGKFSACLLAQIQEVIQQEEASILKDKHSKQVQRYIKNQTGLIVQQEIPQAMIEAENKFVQEMKQTKGMELVKYNQLPMWLTGFPVILDLNAFKQ